MSNLYLLKSEKDRSKVRDVILNLDKAFSIRCVIHHEGDFLIALDYTHEDSVVVAFSTEVLARAELKSIITAMGGNPAIADEIIFSVQKPKKEQEMLRKLKEILE